jgi:hypothetical protein
MLTHYNPQARSMSTVCLRTDVSGPDVAAARSGMESCMIEKK